MDYVGEVSYYKREWMPHHNEAHARMFNKKVFALYPDLGTSKTAMLIRDFLDQWLCGEIDILFVIAPVGVHRQWIEEELPKVTTQKCITAAWPEPPPMQKTGLPRIFTIYPEAFRRKPKPPPRNKGESLGDFRKRRKVWRSTHQDIMIQLLDYIKSARCMGVIDESQMIMNLSKTLRRCLILKPHFVKRRIASGYPAPKGLIQYWPQYNWLDSKILNCPKRAQFVYKYCELGGYMGKEIVGDKNEEEFYRTVGPYTYTVPLEDCVDMPKRSWIEIPVELSPEQQRIIKQIKEEFKAELEEETLYMPNVLQRLTRIQQATCGFLPIDVREKGEDKPNIQLKWLKEYRTQALLTTLQQIKGKVIIWSRFRPCIERLSKVLGDQCVTFYGGDSQAQRADNKRRFIKDPKTRYILMQYKSGATGTDGLQEAARYTLYWSSSHDSQQRVQSERRTWRLGQKEKCVYGDLLARGTYDYQIRRVLMKRENVSKSIRNGIRQWANA